MVLGIVAYILGISCHRLCTFIMERVKWFNTNRYELSHQKKEWVNNAIMETGKKGGFIIDQKEQNKEGNNLPDETDKINSEQYLFSDAFTLAFGGSAERDIIMAREGFFKTILIAFTLVTIAFIFFSVFGGVIVQINPGTYMEPGLVMTIIITIASAGLTLLFGYSLTFFRYVKKNTAKLLFLSYWVKAKMTETK